ncbi:UPF0481 protein At3g47200 [Lactuca sativa]|uniref:UPF0481 protein At3g47200 n=1 Tax=Lactuca sativa TaxID=4236 RepID=UPI000CB2D42D|nr:UPF0481 protein At3g47200 [Lactuca sativa]
MATSDVELQIEDRIGRTVLQELRDDKEKAPDLGNGGLPLIFMVPSVFRDLSPKCFQPRMVSIGPLHKQDKHLNEFEVKKTTYVHRFLYSLGTTPDQMLEDCVLKVSSKLKFIKSCYAESTIYNDLDLTKMMVIDACFILYFIHNHTERYGPFPINMLLTPSITLDLLLLENQIPFFVLKDIFESTILKYNATTSLSLYMHKLLISYNILEDNFVRRNVSLDRNHDHILGLLHKHFHPVNNIRSGDYTNPKRHSAMELDRAGVSFMPYEDDNWALAMKVEYLPRFSWFPWFWNKPTLRMPKLIVDDRTELFLRNLIIYEQSSLVPKYVTTYAWAIGMLIETPEDVAKLAKSEVLVTVSSDQNARNLINNICKEVLYGDFFYHQQWQELDDYYNSYWPNAIAGLKRTYFSSPWNMIALFAGIVLFVLTVVQTIFAVMAENP